MINPDFVYSQNSLQDFLQCPRRFQLRHLLRLSWPAPETADQASFQNHLEQGQIFHNNIQQYFNGIPEEAISASIQDDLLLTWWKNFLASVKGFPWSSLPQQPGGFSIHTEYSLSARLREHRLTAKYDLIAALPGRQFWIYDWKTSLSTPRREDLEQRVQTRLYSWMLVRAGAHLNGGTPILPDQVLMTYWFAQKPGRPLVFPYSAAQCADDERGLGNLLDYISSLSEDDFRLTDDTRHCRFCTYRSYCERGFAPGKWAEAADESDLLDLPSWGEIDPLE